MKRGSSSSPRSRPILFLACALAFAGPALGTAEAPLSSAIFSLRVNGAAFGEAIVLMDGAGKPRIPATLLRQVLGPYANDAALAAISAGPSLWSEADLAAIGVESRFDLADLAIDLIPKAEALRARVLAAQEEAANPPSGVLVKPSFISASLGLSARLLSEGRSLGRPLVEVAADPVLSMGSLVLVGGLDASYDGKVSTSLREARLVEDLPPIQTRVAAGLVEAEALSFQTPQAILGVAAWKESSLAPASARRGPDSEGFTVERPAWVELEINGMVLRRFRVEPGAYRVSDLPLAAGLNEVVLRIEEEGRAVRFVALGLPFGAGLLQPGELDWYAAAGVERETPDRPFGTASLSAGLSRSVTAGLDAQAGADSLLAGATLGWASALGQLSLGGAGSYRYGGGAGELSGAARLSWLLAFPGRARAPSLGASAEYRSEGFAPPRPAASGEASSEPWRLSAQIAQALPSGLSLALAGSAALGAAGPERFSASSALYLAGLGAATLALSAGFDWRRDQGFSPSAALSLTAAVPARGSLAYRRDLLAASDTIAVSAPLGPLTASAGVEAPLPLMLEGGGAPAGSEASLGFRLPVGAFDLGGTASAEARDEGGPLWRLEATASTNLLFAGGRFGAARGVGEAFALVVADDSLEGRPFSVLGRGGAVLAGSSGRSAAVANLQPYRETSVGIEAPFADPGLILSPPSVTFAPTYRSGSLVRLSLSAPVGFKALVVDVAGRPLRYRFAELRPVGGGEGLAVFTDGDGVVECLEAKPDRYELRLDGGVSSPFALEARPRGFGVADLGSLVIDFGGGS